jgi:hypothetical protein
VGAILGGVETAANAGSRLINTASTSIKVLDRGINMLDNWAADAELNQADNSIVRAKTRRLYLLEQAASERTRSQLALASEMHSNPQTKLLFDANFAELSALFD